MTWLSDRSHAAEINWRLYRSQPKKSHEKVVDPFVAEMEKAERQPGEEDENN